MAISYKKTRNMDKLLETGRKRRDERLGKGEERVSKRRPAASSNGGGDADGLAELVASIKRKSGGGTKGRPAKMPRLAT
jgi:hypothetical protein